MTDTPAGAAPLRERAGEPTPDVRALGIDDDAVFNMLGVRNINALKNANLRTIGDVLAKTEDELRRVKCFGPKGIEAVGRLREWVARQIENGRTFHESFDARDWAAAFVRYVEINPAIPREEGTMLGWFANALMRGYDQRQPEIDKLEAEVARLTDARAAAPTDDEWVPDETCTVCKGSGIVSYATPHTPSEPCLCVQPRLKTTDRAAPTSAEPVAKRCRCGAAIWVDHFTVDRDGQDWPASIIRNSRDNEPHSCPPLDVGDEPVPEVPVGFALRWPDGAVRLYTTDESEARHEAARLNRLDRNVTVVPLYASPAPQVAALSERIAVLEAQEGEWLLADATVARQKGEIEDLEVQVASLSAALEAAKRENHEMRAALPSGDATR